MESLVGNLNANSKNAMLGQYYQQFD